MFLPWQPGSQLPRRKESLKLPVETHLHSAEPYGWKFHHKDLVDTNLLAQSSGEATCWKFGAENELVRSNDKVSCTVSSLRVLKWPPRNCTTPVSCHNPGKWLLIKEPSQCRVIEGEMASSIFLGLGLSFSCATENKAVFPRKEWGDRPQLLLSPSVLSTAGHTSYYEGPTLFRMVSYLLYCHGLFILPYKLLAQRKTDPCGKENTDQVWYTHDFHLKEL